MSRARDFADLAGSADAGGLTGRNRIINGDMRIDQRNAGASVTANGSYTLDRWVCPSVVASKYTVQQSTTAPVGFVNSLLVTSSSAYSVGASEYFLIQQFIEGTSISDLAWGTANAKTVTLSFWVRSSLTGVFGGVISGGQYYPFTYTINSADTWEQKSITISGSTSGTWNTNTSRGIGVRFSLGTGSTYSGAAGSWSGSTYFSATGATSVVGTSGATWYITGVQLEVGETATPFEHEDYGTTLRKCARYYYKINTNSSGDTYAMGGMSITTTTFHALSNMAEMRTAPTALETNGTAGDYRVVRGGLGSAAVCNAVPTLQFAGPNSANCYATVASGLSSSSAGSLQLNSTTAFLAWSAEL